MENTLFFGNGINLLNPENIRWKELLDIIKESNLFDNNNLPNTMIYERIILEKPNKSENVLNDEFKVKNKIADLMSSIKSNQVYLDLFKLNAQHYITTNYDYAFIESILESQIINLPIHEYSSEDVYSIRRLKRISNHKELKKHFWQIHGEIRKPATIMLGLDHYCGEIGKIDNYIKGSYRFTENKETIIEKPLSEKLTHNDFSGTSWIELFFNSNIHILGFSFDFAEIDLWWIINKRARLKKSELGKYITNEINFYSLEKNDHLKGILKSMNVNYIFIETEKEETKYVDYYKSVNEVLKKNIKTSL